MLNTETVTVEERSELGVVKTFCVLSVMQMTKRYCFCNLYEVGASEQFDI